MKGDVRVKGIARLECKTTAKKSFTVTLDMAQKIEQAGLTSGEIPALIIEFIDEQGNRIKELAVVPTWVLENLQ